MVRPWNVKTVVLNRFDFSGSWLRSILRDKWWFHRYSVHVILLPTVYHRKCMHFLRNAEVVGDISEYSDWNVTRQLRNNSCLFQMLQDNEIKSQYFSSFNVKSCYRDWIFHKWHKISGSLVFFIFKFCVFNNDLFFKYWVILDLKWYAY